jgi:hypothetical protein
MLMERDLTTKAYLGNSMLLMRINSQRVIGSFFFLKQVSCKFVFLSQQPLETGE